MTKLPIVDPANALDMTSTIAEARDSIKRIEGSTDRINKIVQDVATPVEAKRQPDYQSFSERFISFVLVCVVALLGFFGVMFFNITQSNEAQLTELSNRINQLEAKIKPPLHSSGQ
jgi:hypothetical protein